MADVNRSTATFAISGEIDIENALAVGEELSAWIDRTDSAEYVVDCSSITFVGSRGLAMMARVQRRAQELGVLLVWSQPSEHVLHVIGLAGLDGYLELRV